MQSLAQPLLGSGDCSDRFSLSGGSGSGSGGDEGSPLPPSASAARLQPSESPGLLRPPLRIRAGASDAHAANLAHGQGGGGTGGGHGGAGVGPHNGRAALPLTPWPRAVSHALPILMMNLAQSLAQAQLVCLGTTLDAPGVAAMHMLGLVVVQLFFLGLSRISRYAIATPDVTVGLLCHAAIANVYASTGDLPEPAKVQTALAALCVCTLLQGGCYLFLGRLRASELVQYVPYPVVCGLLGVTGLGICCGALGIAGFDVGFVHRGWPLDSVSLGSPDQVYYDPASSSSSFSSASASASASASVTYGAPSDFLREAQRRPAQLVATLAFAASSVVIASLTGQGTAFLLCVPASLLLFYGGASFAEAGEAELVAQGWLFERSGHNHPLGDMWRARDLASVHWRIAMPDTIGTGLRMLISLVALVLKVIAVENASGGGVSVDVDAELRTAGLANLAVGLVGGSLANHSALHVAPLRRAGVADRRVAAIVLSATALILVAGLPLMDGVPKFVLAGLLLALGVQMVLDWVWSSRTRMDSVGVATLWLMILTMVLAGTTNSIFVGLLAAVGSSHLRVSRLNALAYHRTGRSLHAPASRSPHARRMLHHHGKAIHLLGLEGFLFEGSTSRLLR
jgi:SulP family sulfate permease